MIHQRDEGWLAVRLGIRPTPHLAKGATDELGAQLSVEDNDTDGKRSIAARRADNSLWTRADLAASSRRRFQLHRIVVAPATEIDASQRDRLWGTGCRGLKPVGCWSLKDVVII